ncbi:serine/threonine-protein kinase PCRK1-like isoform X2 [Telopea speciosissima]|uniref:serine/threonine-protein kinase PCRK1-like isoform X2 n=1 Tax=Telopea speciosissima TaxID=54955 RepID=UPI001CC66CEA|nr:serine/threonine-protein kinase PCRK1-like isoform X2 [Telopea speciosissima]
MKCFHFSNGEKREEEHGVMSRVSRVSWARSLSIASSTADVRRSEFGSESRDFSESLSFHDFFSQRRPNDLRVFSFSELRSATRGFSRALMIGEGGFGCVYRAIVTVSDDDPDAKMHVAIKQLNRNGLQGHKEWITEVNYLGVVKHPNLVRLVGYCAEDDERGIQRLLVYELMRNKSLEDHILARMPSSLPWEMRLKIALDAARGLAYLHEEMDFQLIFRDFKSSNILLDEDFNAKLSDFGLARLGPTEGLGHVSTSVVGTVGYAAPEYIQTGRLTAKSDVWSFGVVLYELISGRRSVDRNLPRSEQKLLEWVKPYVSDSKKFHLILDPRLEEGSSCIKSAQKLASLANKCLMKQSKSRPKMSEVVEMLGQIIAEASSTSDGGVSQSMKETEPVKEDNVAENESTKQGGSYLKRVFDFREIVSFRNRSSGKLDWRNWTPGLVRTW